MVDLLIDAGLAGLIVALWLDIRRRFIAKVIAPLELPEAPAPEVPVPPVQPTIVVNPPKKRLSITHVKTLHPDGSVTYERQ